MPFIGGGLVPGKRMNYNFWSFTGKNFSCSHLSCL
jgi:hypothetical protein